MRTDAAISRFRRDLTLGSVLKVVLILAIAAAFAVGPISASRIDGPVILLGIVVLWLVLSYRSMKGSQLIADSPRLIAAGQLDRAEQQIETALGSFSIFRTVKLLAIHHLAMLRHAQRRWEESAALCQLLLRQRLGNMQNLSKPCRLILADALLEMNDLPGVYEALSGLYQTRLSLAEAMNLLLVQLDYSSRVGAWENMMQGIPAKVQLAELMPTQGAARAQAFLALAARKTGRHDWENWLRRRVELLADPQQIAAERPVLAGLWTEEQQEISP
jgi:hypothetical protein